MPLGNDIVDLRAAARHRPAYYERLKRSSFYPEELLLVQEYESAFWLLWAAKESAFKAVAQAGRVDRRFNPKDFLLKEIHQTEEGIIYTIDCKPFRFNGIIDLEKDFLHALSWTEPKPHFLTEVIYSEETDYQDQSSLLRNIILEQMSKMFDDSITAITIDKDENMIPFFRKGDERLPNNLSLSHHGSYLAYAFTI